MPRRHQSAESPVPEMSSGLLAHCDTRVLRVRNQRCTKDVWWSFGTRLHQSAESQVPEMSGGLLVHCDTRVLRVRYQRC
ncbi:hypothetical protein MAR_031636, partial [Mya arenaria]